MGSTGVGILVDVEWQPPGADLSGAGDGEHGGANHWQQERAGL